MMFSLTHHERKVLLFIAILIFCGALLRLFNVQINRPSANIQSQKQAQEVFPVNINTANLTELEKIPGIGPELAGRIILYRTNHGFFNSLEDLKKVKGIGDKKLKVMQDYITVQD